MAKEAPEKKSPSSPPPVQNGGGTYSRTGPVQERRSSAGRWLLLIVLLAITGGLVWYYYNDVLGTGTAAAGAGGKKGKGGTADIARVVTGVARSGNIDVFLKGLGQVTPLKTAIVNSRVSGQLMKVLFQEGQMVKEGDLLVQIDDRPFKAQVDQYTAQKEHDQALLDNAKIDLDRYQKLWQQDSIPEQELATQASLVKQDQGTVDSDQALIDTAQLNVTYSAIMAPFSGRVGLRLIDEGNQIEANSTNGLLVLTQIQPITVVFTIPEDSVPAVLDKIRAGTTLTVDAYDRAGFTTKLADGTLLATDNEIDPSTGTLKLKATFANTNNELFPNQFVNTRLVVETKKNVTLIPTEAIQYGTGTAEFVYVVDMNYKDSNTTKPNPLLKQVHLKTITEGTRDDDQQIAEVTSGIAPGDTIVTDGVDKLQEGSLVILSTDDTGASAGAAPAAGTHSGHKKKPGDSTKPGDTTAPPAAAPGSAG